MLKLNKTIGRSYNSTPKDIYNTKAALNHMGYYEINPAAGLNEWVDTQMFNSIEKYQADNGLRVDAVIKPDGPTQGSINNSLMANSYGYQTNPNDTSIIQTTYATGQGPTCAAPPKCGQNPGPGDQPLS